MRLSESFTVGRAVLAVVWLGMGAFVALHSVLVFRAGAEQIRSLVRVTWFVGLGVVAATILYSAVGEDSTGDDA